MNVSNQQTSALDALQASKAQGFERLAESGDPVVAAEQFESLFASMLVKEMRSTVEGGFFGDGPGAGQAWGCDLSYKYVEINAEYTT